ncbi:polysaccharide biosynthesis tyrosine autokinase [Donghicola sp. C2-DW-16]|uniref:non-specific protein-tyrosine kinase n=1 Tax=Donghicola mangrovi TaxID=2729614 RepID=A0ABX2PG31_9RHOB|nr:polysaccharide biosynthesis tyrosine autokinase [Donghicola mangrovi]NVO27982.1 polysaccharide biosynthesis tyrosine autokinase [Donghicola mangrovi]
MTDFGTQSPHFSAQVAGRQMYDAETIRPEEDDKADLSRMVRSIWVRKYIVFGCILGFAVLFFAFAAFQPKQFTANTTVMLDARGQQIVSLQEQVVGDLKLDNPLVESEVTVLRSMALLHTAIENIGVDRFDTLFGEDGFEYFEDSLIPKETQRLNFIADKLSEGINVYRVGESYVIAVSVMTTDAELSAVVANALVDAYINDQLNDRQTMANSATRWLQDQVEEARQHVVAAEATVEDFKRQLLLSSGASEEVLQQQLAELNQQLALARSERATEEARLSQTLALKDSQGAIAVAETLDVPYVTAMREARQELLRKDAALSSSLGANHPDRRNLAKEVSEIDANIATEVDNILRGYDGRIEVLVNREEALSKDVANLQSKLSALASSSLRLRQLEREAEAARLRFDELLTRLGMTQAQVEIQRADAKIINPASIPQVPSAPRVKLMTMFGGAIGMTIGLVTVLIMEMMRGGFATVRQLESATGLPVMTVLPSAEVKSPKDIISLLNSRGYHLLNERIRQLRVMLPIATRKQKNCYMLLSSDPNEGKTSTAVALAHAHAKAGASTILVDLDNRRGSLQAEFTDGQLVDLSNYFNGEVPIDEAIIKGQQTLFDITGASHQHAMIADSVSGEQLRKMVEELKARYDVVVIDAPPILAVSDGLQIAPVVDWVLYLVRWRFTSEKSVKYGLDTLQNVGVRNIGLVLTMVDVREDPDGYAQKYDYH